MRSVVAHHVVRAAQLPTVRPAYAAGGRAALATIGSMIVGQAIGHPYAGTWMGLAGFNVSLGDKGGSRLTRVRAMGASLVAGALGAAAGAIAGRAGWSAVALGALWALAAGLARTWGSAAASAGVVSLATFVISIASPEPSVTAVLERAAAYGAGGAIAIALALAAWRTRPYRAARVAVGRAYAAVASRDPGARAAIDHARMTLAAVRRGLTSRVRTGWRSA